MAFNIPTTISTPNPSKEYISHFGKKRTALKPAELEGGITSGSIAITSKHITTK